MLKVTGKGGPPFADYKKTTKSIKPSALIPTVVFLWDTKKFFHLFSLTKKIMRNCPFDWVSVICERERKSGLSFCTPSFKIVCL